jgi:hypothetical protein
MSKALLGRRFRKEEEKGETGTIYIEPSRERNIGLLSCRIIDSIAKFDS